MGLDFNGARFVLYARSRGVDLTKMAMIGRQTLNLAPADLKENLSDFGFPSDAATVERLLGAKNRYAEEFFRLIGARNIHSFDYSDYEGASHLHDMNEDLPGEFREQYSAVLDGGSLEHVFNFPVALRNCMEMVRVGGHYVGLTPANNFFGHGFYQFSPELHFSVFTEANGYELVDLIASEDEPGSQWYSVKSPASLRSRVTLTNCRPTYLLILAKRISSTVPFKSAPKQSDYMTIWSNSAAAGGSLNPGDKADVRAAVIRVLPQSWKRFVKRLLRRREVGFAPRFFTPIDPTPAVREKRNQ
jgi:hypothetical protein